jgi:membrane protease YdiL (CAAX protease family)
MINANSIRPRQFIVFLLLAFACIGSSIAGQMFVPGMNTVPRIVRAMLAVSGLFAIAFGSERLLARQFHGEITLGLKPSARSLTGLLFGAAGGLVLVAGFAGGLWLFSPFHFERGPATVRQIFPDVQNYFLSNIGEELVFRGYLLIVLARRFGLNIALLVIACLFGLFHLPGLSGLAAVKMIFTTAACSYLFAGAFLASGTIWAAIALHFVANVALHKITGLDNGVALLQPVMQSPDQHSYDPAFWICVILPLMMAYPLIAYRSPMRLIVTVGVEPRIGTNFHEGLATKKHKGHKMGD